MDTLTIILIALIVIQLGITFKNLASKAEMKRIIRQEKPVIVHHDKRVWVKIVRIFLALLFAACLVFVLYSQLILQTGMDDLTIAAALFGVVVLYFAVAPYSFYEWILLEKGVYVYNAGKMIPWAQMINCGVAKPKKNRELYRVSISIKKVQGEYLKSTMQILGVDSKEEGDSVNELIHEFIRVLERKKMYRHEMQEREERRQERKKRFF